MAEENKKIEVVTGNGKELDISTVENHLNIAKPKIKKAEDKEKQIIIPKQGE